MAVRIGLVGAGGIGRYHVDQLAKLDDVQIVGVADIVLPRAEELAQRAGGCRAFSSHIEMYDATTPDAVCIGIPPFAHTDQVTAAAERGIAVFVQKPPALTMEKARAVASVINQTHTISAVGFQDRYLDVIAEAKQALVGQEPGLAMGYWMGGFPEVGWWRRRSGSGGQAVEQTIHIFDSARYLFGEAESVVATAQTGLMTHVPDYDIDDSSAMTIRFRSGVLCTIFSACFLREAPGRAGMDIFCRDLKVEYDLRSSVRIRDRRVTREVRCTNDFNRDCMKTFVDAVRSGDPSAIRSPYADAVETLALPLAGERSRQTGTVVRLD